MADKSTCHCNLVCFLGADEKGMLNCGKPYSFGLLSFARRTIGSIQNVGAKTLHGHFLSSLEVL